MLVLQCSRRLWPGSADAAEVDRRGGGNRAQDAPMRQLMAYLDVFGPAIANEYGASSKRPIRARTSRASSDSAPNGRLRPARDTLGKRARGIRVRARTQLDQFARFTIAVDSSDAHKIERDAASSRPAAGGIRDCAYERELICVGAPRQTRDGRRGGSILRRRDRRSSAAAEQVLLSGAYGMADRERKVANTLDTSSASVR
jgi:hypothetical protein